MLADVAHADGPEAEHPDPTQQAEARRRRDEHHPEPEEDVDLLVEQVDGQHALDGVRMDRAHLTDLEVAQRDPREAASRRPVVARDEVDYDADAVDVVIGAQEAVQEEQLREDIGEVQDLCGEVQHHQVVAASVAAQHAQVLGEEVLDEHATSAAVLALIVQVVIHVTDHVLDRLVASFRIQRVLDRLGRLDEVVHVDSGSVAEDAPEQARDVEQERLDEQHHRHPLVVADVTLQCSRHPGQACLRQVVRVRHPADLVGERLVVAGEVGRTPAVDRVADVLGRADDDREDDHEDDRVAVVKAVGEVVIVAHVDLGDLEDGADEAATRQEAPSVRVRTHTAP